VPLVEIELPGSVVALKDCVASFVNGFSSVPRWKKYSTSRSGFPACCDAFIVNEKDEHQLADIGIGAPNDGTTR
jgi:hypothetical protein